jgi:hypothetical protein
MDEVDHWALTPAAVEICMARKTTAYVAPSTLSCERHHPFPFLHALWISVDYGEMTHEHAPLSHHLPVCPNSYHKCNQFQQMICVTCKWIFSQVLFYHNLYKTTTKPMLLNGFVQTATHTLPFPSK